MLRDGTVAELSHAVVAPANQATARDDRTRMLDSRGNLRGSADAADSNRRLGLGRAPASQLAGAIISPAENPATANHGAGVLTVVFGEIARNRPAASRNVAGTDDTANGDRVVSYVPQLAVRVVPPTLHPAVGDQRARVAAGRGDLNRVSETSHYHRCAPCAFTDMAIANLAVGIIAPADDPACPQQRA